MPPALLNSKSREGGFLRVTVPEGLPAFSYLHAFFLPFLVWVPFRNKTQ